MRETEPDPAAIVKEHEEVFRRLAESDLPIAADAQRALQLLEETQPVRLR